jgi:phosphohistidine phosphatase
MHLQENINIKYRNLNKAIIVLSFSLVENPSGKQCERAKQLKKDSEQVGMTTWEVTMFLYLVQHGDAKREEEDPARPLSDKGIKDLKKVASFLSRLNITVEEVLHSGKLRAKQTAEIMADSLRITKGALETESLLPLDEPDIWSEKLKSRTHSLMLVGHLPHLGKLSSFLLSGDSGKSIIAFKMGGIVCMKRDDAAIWTLQWMVTPEIL